MKAHLVRCPVLYVYFIKNTFFFLPNPGNSKIWFLLPTISFTIPISTSALYSFISNQCVYKKMYF